MNHWYAVINHSCYLRQKTCRQPVELSSLVDSLTVTNTMDAFSWLSEDNHSYEGVSFNDVCDVASKVFHSVADNFPIPSTKIAIRAKSETDPNDYP